MALIKHVIAFSPKFFARAATEAQKRHIKRSCPTNSVLRQLSRQPTPSSAFSRYMKKNQNGATHTIEVWIAADIQPYKVFSWYWQKRPLYSVKDLQNSIAVSLQMIFFLKV